MASHDLHFDVQGVPVQGAFATTEIPVRGEMDHLPDSNDAGGGSNGGMAAYFSKRLSESSHPTACIFHLLFKGAALTLYIFGGWVVGTGNSAEQGSHFITLTVTCILLLAADFWVVKNVTGRLLVGLRWWNQVQDDDTKWIFESAEDRVINKFDQSIFWTVLYATPLVWAALFVLGLLKFQVNWLLIVVMALCLNLSNVYGYYKCSKDQKVRFQQMIHQGAQQGAMAVMRSNMLTLVTGAAGAPLGGAGRSNTYV